LQQLEAKRRREIMVEEGRKVIRGEVVDERVILSREYMNSKWTTEEIISHDLKISRPLTRSLIDNISDPVKHEAAIKVARRHIPIRCLEYINRAWELVKNEFTGKVMKDLELVRKTVEEKLGNIRNLVKEYTLRYIDELKAGFAACLA
jgi:thiamine kinase-like enzyme